MLLFNNCIYYILTVCTNKVNCICKIYTVYGLQGVGMEIILSSTSSKPIYEQIVSQIKEMIMNGTLKPNDQLPSMRKLAKDLHVSIITTQRAYDELAKDGFIIVVAAKGAFVSKQNKDFISEENYRRIENKISQVCELAKENGITLTELINVLELMYKEQ